jgi:hypothetical protein
LDGQLRHATLIIDRNRPGVTTEIPALRRAWKWR